jgi:hypothetical protein
MMFGNAKIPYADRHETSTVMQASLAASVGSVGLGALRPDLKLDRRAIFFPTAFALGFMEDWRRGTPPAESATRHALIGTAGLIAAASANKYIAPAAGKYWTEWLEKETNEKLKKTLVNLNDFATKSPVLRNIISKQTLGIAAGVAAMPIAARIVDRIMGIWKRKSSPEHSNETMTVHNMSSRAGEVQGEKDQNEVLQTRPAGDINIRGQVGTTFDTQRALQQFHEDVR